MVPPERDSTEEWLLPAERRPPTIGELQERIDEALVTARLSEAVVMTVGAAALDAAEQARRAAVLAERAASSAAEAQASGAAAAGVTSAGVPSASPPTKSEDFGDFDARADRLMERLRRLQRVPLGPASPVEAPPQAPR